MTTQKTIENFWKRVVKTKDCWNWVGTTNNYGYSSLLIKGKYWQGHRFSYTLKNGPIPEGLVIDHLCRNRVCVNPKHLELVTNKENILRGVGPTAINKSKTQCSNGHKYNTKNTYISKEGRRYCRVCDRLRKRVRYSARKTQTIT